MNSSSYIQLKRHPSCSLDCTANSSPWKLALHQLQNPWLLKRRKHKAIDQCFNHIVTGGGAGDFYADLKRDNFHLALTFNKLFIHATEKRYTVCSSGTHEII